MSHKFIKLSKIGVAEDALFDSPPIHDYLMGEDNGNVSLPVDYWLEGYIEEAPKVGETFVVARTSRNGFVMGGIFTSSTVTEITEDGFKTMNSIYKLDYI